MTKSPSRKNWNPVLYCDRDVFQELVYAGGTHDSLDRTTAFSYLLYCDRDVFQELVYAGGTHDSLDRTTRDYSVK